MPGVKEIAVFTRHDPYCSRLVGEADMIIMCDFNNATHSLVNNPLFIHSLLEQSHHHFVDLRIIAVDSEILPIRCSCARIPTALKSLREANMIFRCVMYAAICTVAEVTLWRPVAAYIRYRRRSFCKTGHRLPR